MHSPNWFFISNEIGRTRVHQKRMGQCPNVARVMNQTERQIFSKSFLVVWRPMRNLHTKLTIISFTKFENIWYRFSTSISVSPSDHHFNFNGFLIIVFINNKWWYHGPVHPVPNFPHIKSNTRMLSVINSNILLAYNFYQVAIQIDKIGSRCGRFI